MEQWQIFDPNTGFGGDGVSGTYELPPDPLPDNIGSTNPPTADFLPREQCYKGCVQDGPFANLTLHIGPGRLYTERCLVRGFDPSRRRQLSGPVIEGLMESRTFEEFRQGIDITGTGIHTAGHALVGGEVSNLYSAGGGK
jgi:tyrosinase